MSYRQGLAMDVDTGHIPLLQTVQPEVLDPQKILHCIRLWSQDSNVKNLLPIHSHRQDQIYIPKFPFREFEGTDMLMNLPDDVMLEYSSTSPECEGADFCRHLRESCQLLMDMTVGDVFGVERKRLVYRLNRNKNKNDWISL